jgi:hypothetical protein
MESALVSKLAQLIMQKTTANSFLRQLECLLVPNGGKHQLAYSIHSQKILPYSMRHTRKPVPILFQNHGAWLNACGQNNQKYVISFTQLALMAASSMETLDILTLQLNIQPRIRIELQVSLVLLINTLSRSLSIRVKVFAE